jgi:hypothetical protein
VIYVIGALIAITSAVSGWGIARWKWLRALWERASERDVRMDKLEQRMAAMSAQVAYHRECIEALEPKFKTGITRSVTVL